tara:strand:- start:33 stop:527 length:495 start_codon:yes stop_codon:yes gene_type:complete
MENILVERFQQLAGIKPLYEQSYTETVYRIFSCPAHFGESDTELFKTNQEMIQNEFEGTPFGREKKDVMCNVNGKPTYPGASIEGAEIYGRETHSHEDKGEAAKERKDKLINELNLEAYSLLKEVKDEMPGLGNIEELMLLVNEEKIEHLHYFVRQVDTQTSTI